MAHSENLISLIYLSSEAVPFSEQDLIELLEKSRQSNAALGMTGMLLYKDGNFLQVLEGETEKVLALYEKIRQDERHRSLTILSREAISHRDFPDWSMGFRDLRSPDTVRRPDFSHFVDTSLTAADLSADPGRARKLLMFFKEDKASVKSVGAC
ncbi:MAG: BLUF domain-containing protein [Candidatus Sulfotelmatobacter sp.]